MPAPAPTKAEPSSSEKEGISSQKLMLFMRGKAMSGAPIISGTNQLPKPPIIAGMTTKNTMIRPWARDHDVPHLAVDGAVRGDQVLNARLLQLERASAPRTARR